MTFYFLMASMNKLNQFTKPLNIYIFLIGELNIELFESTLFHYNPNKILRGN